MKTVPNDIVKTLIRVLPIILSNMDAESMRKNTRLGNAVRLARLIHKRLKQYEDQA